MLKQSRHVEPGHARAWLSAGSLAVLIAILMACLVIAQAVPSIIRYRDVFPSYDMVDVVYRYFIGPPIDFWIYHGNEHLPLFVMPLYWLDLNLFSAQGTFLTGCMLCLAVAIGLAPFPASLRAHKPDLLMPFALGLTGAAMNVWLGGYTNLVWTHQVQMYVSLYAVMVAIGLAARDRPRRLRHLAGMAACLVVATFSFGYGIIGFPVLLALGLLRRWNWRRLAFLATVLVVCLAIYIALNAPSLARGVARGLAFESLYYIAVFALTFVASPPYNLLRQFLPDSTAYAVAWCAGGAGVAVYIWHIVHCRWKPPSEYCSWAIALGLFTMLVAAETAYARAFFGYQAAADGRYIVGQLPFWLGLLLLAARPSTAATSRARPILVVALPLILALLLASQFRILPAMRAHSYGRYAAAMVAIDGVGDPSVYAIIQALKPDRVPVIIAGLKARQWSAFAWPQNKMIGKPLSSFGGNVTGCVGFVDSDIAVGDAAGRRVMGWAGDAHATDQWILLVDGAGVVRGVGHSGGPRPDVVGATHRPDLLYAGWTGYVRRPIGDKIAAYLLVKDKHPCHIAGPQ